MPLIIQDNGTTQVVGTQSTNLVSFSPKFFHGSVLTGKGGTSKGLLNENVDPKMYKDGYNIQPNPSMMYNHTYTKDTEIYQIPFFMIHPSLWDSIKEMPLPELHEMTRIAGKSTGESIYLQMPIHCIELRIQEIPGPAGSSVKTKTKDLSAAFETFVYSVKDPNDKVVHNGGLMTNLTKPNNQFYTDIVYNMVHYLRQLEAQLTNMGYQTDRTAMEAFLKNYSLYVEICKASERWNTKIKEIISDILIRNVSKATNNKPDGLWTDRSISVAATLTRLEKYTGVPLDEYLKLYNDMSSYVPMDILNKICRENLKLLMSNTLDHMNKNRAALPFCPCNTHIQTRIPYSNEQISAIESQSPLTLVESGAGTGKSTVILARIDHMIANGIEPQNILVLSFTNAAANHILELKPDIKSMTIASWTHSIYAANYPTHMLSSLSTIINCIEGYYNANNATVSGQQRVFADQFRNVLRNLQNNCYTEANNFIEDHVDEVIDVLNNIQQTSLELESIICYQKMDTLIEPPELHVEHLIIDEVQDNSISEFIYSIKYVDKHQCSLYIVGDCSQTLFEFRAADPKALNVLEASGVFATHKLQTNYRSNQEILDFANVLLGNLESNRYANIQLHANSLRKVTSQSFSDAVKLHYHRLPNRMANNTLQDMLEHSISIETREYIQDKLQKKEQIAILARDRLSLGHLQKAVAAVYPGIKTASLIPQRQYDVSTFSRFAAKYWDEIKFLPPAHILDTIKATILQKIPWMCSSRKNEQREYQRAFQMLNDFDKQFSTQISNWERQVQMNVMSTSQMLAEIRQLLINYEIKHNAVAQALNSNRNEERKRSQDIENADIVFSTIHSAKGLEFPHVIVYYKDEGGQMDEADKRMYYVAFTRAQLSEFIFAFGQYAKPIIKADHDRIIKDLVKAETKAAKLAAGGIVDDDDDDDDDSNVIVISSASNTPFMPDTPLTNHVDVNDMSVDHDADNADLFADVTDDTDDASDDTANGSGEES